MKIIAIGDTHGRDVWKKVLADNPDFDRFVFLGDYFDNFPPHTSKSIVKNFEEILALKAKNPAKVTLIMGNHDFQYSPMGKGERYSGYDENTQAALDEMGDWWEYLTPAAEHQDILFTHAGLTKTWAERAGLPEVMPFGTGMLSEMLVDTFLVTPELFRFWPADSSHCGENVNQGPFWVRPQSLITDMYPDFKQVVGHTYMQKGIVSVDERLILIDTGKQGEYLKIVDGDITVGKAYPSKSEARRVAIMKGEDIEDI